MYIVVMNVHRGYEYASWLSMYNVFMEVHRGYGCASWMCMCIGVHRCILMSIVVMDVYPGYGRTCDLDNKHFTGRIKILF